MVLGPLEPGQQELERLEQQELERLEQQELEQPEQQELELLVADQGGKLALMSISY